MNDLYKATVCHALANASTVLLVQVDNGTETEMGAIYNMTDNTFRPFHIREHPFCSGQALLPNGQGVVVGGKRFPADVTLD